MKSNITVCIDTEVRIELKARAINVSKVINRLLREHLNVEERGHEPKETLILELEKKNVEVADVKTRIAAIEAKEKAEKSRKKEYWE